MNSEPTFYTFWAINGSLNQAKLRGQIDQFKESGFDGVVFHPRFYPGDPEYLCDRYFKEVSDIILYAKSIGLNFWLYDENGWPSGTVGGELIKKYPQDVQLWADLTKEDSEDTLSSFEHEGQTWYLTKRVGEGVDYFSAQLTQHFIEMTHDKYKMALRSEAFEYVSVIFCDEPEFGLGHAYDSLSRFGAIPWTAGLPDIFKKITGKDLFDNISDLFFTSERSARIRTEFYELLTDLFCESFITPIDNWCQSHGKRFTAHVKGEEHPLFQVPTTGSCQRVFNNLSLPGIDALERMPSNNYFPRQLSTAARQFGDGNCMAEAFGGSGWGASPEDLERYLLWLGRNGVTEFVMHLSQYDLNSNAIQDWPPSQPLHLSWSSLYKNVINRVKQELTRKPRLSAEILVVSPHRGIMKNYEPSELLDMNVHDAHVYRDSPAAKINTAFMELIEHLSDNDVNFDVVDERTLEECAKSDNDKLTIGKESYCSVIVAEGSEILAVTEELIQPFIATATYTRAKCSEPQVAASNEKLSIDWELRSLPTNALLLECCRIEATYTTLIACESLETGTKLELIFADTVTQLLHNNESISFAKTANGYKALITASGAIEETISFKLSSEVDKPYVWVRGIFRVKTEEYKPGPNNTLATEGPFVLTSENPQLSSDLIGYGFPFLKESITIDTVVNLGEKSNYLMLTGIDADAVRLVIDGICHEWHWPVTQPIKLLSTLDTGEHTIELELIPNSYNFYGPHHYFNGDAKVINPMTFKGIKNFADPLSAPENTLVNTWHFRKFNTPQYIEFQFKGPY